jgi:hypothetical protein
MKNVTLVIGAGVNKEINQEIALGSELLKDICDRVTDDNSDIKNLSDLLNKIKIQESIRRRFAKDIDRYKVYYEYASIDDFIYKIDTLNKFKDVRNEYLQMAKISIIFHVLGYEDNKTQNSILNDIQNEASWLSVLCKHINREVFNSQKETLNIVTFNYDRILKEYLLEAFKANSKVKNFINNHIFHVYGRIGCLEELKPKKVGEQKIPFGLPNDQIVTIKNIQDHIKLIYEEREVNSGIRE